MNTGVPPCKGEHTNYCSYYITAQKQVDGLDVCATLLAFLALLIKPEESMFPSGLLLYTIPCLFSAFRYSSQTQGQTVLKIINGIVVGLLCVLSFLGTQGMVVCSIPQNKAGVYTGTTLITLDASLGSLFSTGEIISFPARYIVILAAIPIIVSAVRIIIQKSAIKKAEQEA